MFWVAAVLSPLMINPSTGGIGALVPLEQASLAGGALDKERTRTFARHGLTGALSGGAAAIADWLD
jgi:hypothetical protein